MAASAERENLAKEGSGTFNETVTAAVHVLSSSRIAIHLKSLLFFWVFAACCFSAPGARGATAITLTQHASKDAGTTTSSSLAFQSNNTAGNWIAVCVRGGFSSSQVFTITDSNGNTYRQATQVGFTASAVTLAIYYAENVSGGPNTVYVSDTVSGPLRFAILEYSGVATSNSLDVTAMAQGNGPSPSTGSSTTTSNGDLLLGAIATVNTAGFTAGGNYKIEESVPAEPSTKLIAEDRIQAAAGLASASASLLASDTWGAALATFKPAGVASGVAPSITSLNPGYGPVGTSVTISGANFSSTQGSSTVTFNGVTATPASWSATSLVVPVPAGATTGNVIATVGGVASNGVSFTVTTPAPSITSLNPTSGVVGTSVTITGANFGATQGTSTVSLNGTSATPTSWNATSITAPVPSGATTGNILVTVGGLASNGVAFTVTTPAPSITSLNPTSGVVGTSVTITGANFGSTQGSSTVTFNGVTA
ncbi:MAG TPA: IPT/TIG domain-containing protein, partial [Candidatus Acidoferrum sp.]|nr:IPT/TIG domain-containing protein [Candidatus Acidoferrum sp.]